MVVLDASSGKLIATFLCATALPLSGAVEFEDGVHTNSPNSLRNGRLMSAKRLPRDTGWRLRDDAPAPPIEGGAFTATALNVRALRLFCRPRRTVSYAPASGCAASPPEQI